MSANSFGPATADVFRDMAHFDLLPSEVRVIVRDAPVNFKAGTILAVWRLHEFDGGTVKAFCTKLKRKMRAALAAARAGGEPAGEAGRPADQQQGGGGPSG